VDDENNGVSLGRVAHWIRVKIEIVVIVSCIWFSIQTGLMANELFGLKLFSDVGYYEIMGSAKISL